MDLSFENTSLFAVGECVGRERKSFSASSIEVSEYWSTILGESHDQYLDIQFWLETIGRPLAILLSQAGYSEKVQHENLLLFASLAAPALGRRADAFGQPQSWHSFMSDHSTPVELSWAWAQDNEPSTVRYAFEPIGRLAGSAADPLNESTAISLARQIAKITPGCDLSWFEHFTGLLSFNSSQNEREKARRIEGHESRVFLAFDLLGDDVTLKAYFIPAFKAHETGRPKEDLINEAVTSLPDYHKNDFSAYPRLMDFLRTTNTGQSLQAEIVAIDCIPSSKSRIKLYYRSPQTSFASVRRTLCLSDNDASSPQQRLALNKLRALWAALLGLDPNFKEDGELPGHDHRTAGILYYFEIRPGRTTPTAKVYIPVRHYAQNDLSVAHGIAGFRLAQGYDCGASNYCKALELISQEPLHASRGLHTYIGCSLLGDQIQVTSYIAPRAFR